MNRISRLACGLVFVLLLAGCQAAAPNNVTAPTTSPAKSVPLQGTNWQLTGFVEGGVTTAVAEGTSVPMSINDGLLHAKPCNTVSGPVAIDGASFVPGQLVSTMMLCFGDQGDQETRFLAVLGDVTSSEVNGGTLTLTTPDGRALVFQAEV